MTADPGRSGGEGTGQTGWHMHGNVVMNDASCLGFHNERDTHLKRVIVLDPVTARDTIARAICQAEDDYDELIEAQMPRPDRREDFLSTAILAALASQERGE